MKFPKKLHTKLSDRKIDHSFRTLYHQQKWVDFSSNDYLGFAKNKSIAKAVQQEAKHLEFVNGSTGSRLLSGNHTLHDELESALATFFKTPATLLFNSGYNANIGLLSCVPQRGDVVLYDELCHASIRDGVRLSHAKSYSFKHNNLDNLKKKYAKTQPEKGTTYVIVESIYSMDGDVSPLKKIAEFCKKYICYLIVDEAHATGVFGNNGEGIVAKLGLEKRVFARVHTFGKALGCHGAVVAGSLELRNFLINYARSFIYTTALPLHSLLTIKYALKELEKTKAILKLYKNIKLFKKELKINRLEKRFIQSESAIQSCIISNISKAKEIASKLKTQDFNVKAILSPTVPKGMERLRFCIHSYNTSEQIKEVLALLRTFT